MAVGYYMKPTRVVKKQNMELQTCNEGFYLLIKLEIWLMLALAKSLHCWNLRCWKEPFLNLYRNR